MTTRRFQVRSDMMVQFALLLVLLLFLQPLASADEVLISDGSRLIGEVVRHDTEVLKLKTTFAGTLEIDWAEVREVILTEPGTVLLADEQTLEIKALSREGDQFILYTTSSADPIYIEASRVKAFEPESWELGQGNSARAPSTWRSKMNGVIQRSASMTWSWNYTTAGARTT